MYITFVLSTIAITMSILIDKIFGKFDEKEAKKKSTIRIIGEIYLQLGVISVFGYIIRNVMEVIPSPFDGIAGFDHRRVKELSGGLILSFMIYYYQYNLRAKIEYLFNNRIFEKK